MYTNFIPKLLFMIWKFFIFYIILHVQFSYANEFEKGMFALEMEDYERAVYFLSFDLVQGNPRAQHNLGLLYKNGIGVKKDFNEEDFNEAQKLFNNCQQKILPKCWKNLLFNEQIK